MVQTKQIQKGSLQHFWETWTFRSFNFLYRWSSSAAFMKYIIVTLIHRTQDSKHWKHGTVNSALRPLTVASFSTKQLTCCMPKVTACYTGVTYPCLKANSKPRNRVNASQIYHGCSICAPKHHSYFAHHFVSTLWRFSEPETCLQNQVSCWFKCI